MQGKRVCSYIALDVEMTGLKIKEDKIIEIAAIKVVDGEIISTFKTLVNPNRILGENIEKLTGITNEELKKAPYINEILPEFIEFCENFPILGHMISFDFAFIKKEALYMGLSFEKQGIDTLKLARRLLPPEIKKSLKSACEYFGIGMEREHRAIDDALAAHKLYLKLCELGEDEDIFLPRQLNFNIKKDRPATLRQKERLHKLLNCHKIELNVDVNLLTRGEMSRIIDKIISDYGRMESI